MLNEPLAACGKPKAGKPTSRSLRGDGAGAFRARGRYSDVFRATKWAVRDSCAGTLTRATGALSVRDNVRRTTVTLRAGKSYTAKPRR